MSPALEVAVSVVGAFALAGVLTGVVLWIAKRAGRIS